MIIKEKSFLGKFLNFGNLTIYDKPSNACDVVLRTAAQLSILGGVTFLAVAPVWVIGVELLPGANHIHGYFFTFYALIGLMELFLALLLPAFFGTMFLCVASTEVVQGYYYNSPKLRAKVRATKEKVAVYFEENCDPVEWKD